MDTTRNFGVHDGHKDEALLTAEEKAAEEKASRRHWYVCARVAAYSQARRIEQIESGACSGDLESLQTELEHSRRMVAQFEAEFVDDPNIERDVQREIQALADIARAFSEKKDVDK